MACWALGVLGLGLLGFEILAQGFGYGVGLALRGLGVRGLGMATASGSGLKSFGV